MFRSISCRATRWAAFLLTASMSAGIPPGDAGQGAELVKSLGCMNCHSVGGEGAKFAPDLTRNINRGYTPSDMTATMWNHAPAMWSAMEKKKIPVPAISQDQAADLFAYFYATRFFERKGDAARGKRAFVEKGCADCHNITSASAEGARPVMSWDSVADPIELARQMWNHSPGMRVAFEKKKKKIPELNAGEMNDIIIYLQNLPQTRHLKPAATFASAQTGERLFELKGCAGCHTGSHSLSRGAGFRNAADVAAAMWNHASFMKQSSPLRTEEMSRIASYVWSLQFGMPTGNVESGRKVYESKGCQGCHGAKPPESVTADGGNAYGMVSALWNHGPAMLKKATETKTAWPRFSSEEMNHLLTWLATVR